MGVLVPARRDVAVIRLQHGSANAIDEAFLSGLNQALDAIPPDVGVVITGTGRFFSVGLNLKEVYPLSREAMGAFMARFIATLRRVLTWPAPTVAALNGHTLGGGFLLALACDRRLVLPGMKARIGFPDVEEQVPLSHSLRLMAQHALPADMTYLVNGRGENFTPEEAARRGLVEMVAGSRFHVEGGRRAGNIGLAGSGDPNQGPMVDLPPVTYHAVAWAAEQPMDYAERKTQRLKPLLAQLDALGEEDIEHFLDQWFAPATRAAFGRVWERLT